ncbi:nucleotide-diphospho-sugar transferase, partial [Gorgonomyces haynaldii]
MQALEQKYQQAGQGQVFQFKDSLSQTEKEQLQKTLSSIDIDRCNRIFKTATTAPPNSNASVSPLPDAAFDSTISNPEKVKHWREIGLKLIAQNKVGVILLAGGQGTRLGSSAPKGCYDIGLPSHKSLFQLQGERILRLQQVASQYSNGQKVVIPWYVMTSGPTHDNTVEFFKSKHFFGLDPQNVIFFQQGVLPAFTPEGKIFMETKSSPALSPDGNGGIYAALRKEGVIDDLEKRGIPYVHCYCVDNCLVKVGDPVFIGYCVEKNADCGAKSVPKVSPTESVGVICLRNNKFAVVEYSEIDPKLAEQRKPDGTLVYNAANIANHFYTTAFLKKIEEFESKLEYHIAKKKITHVDAQGKTVKPNEANGIKLELFIFDVFPFTERMAVLEVARKDEFSPLKNAPGSKDGDSPETSRHDIMAQHVRFVQAHGGVVASTPGYDTPQFEISPLVTYDGEGLEKLNGVTIPTPKLISSQADIQAMLQ